MKFLKHYLVLVVFIVCVDGLLYGKVRTAKIDSPSLNVSITADEYETVLMRAQNIELESIRLLILHLDSTGDMEEANIWRQQAFALGDPFELRKKFELLFKQSQNANLSLLERQNLLVQSLSTAERISKSDRIDYDNEFIHKVKDHIARNAGVKP